MYASLDEVPADEKRPIAVLTADIDLPEAARKAIRALSSNHKGFFPNTFLFQVIMDAWGWKPDR